jgi:general secretion pathway protein I
LYAESILAAIGRETPLTRATHSGPIDDRFSWRGSVTPTPRHAGPEKPKFGPIGSGRGVLAGCVQTRSVVLETLRLAPVEPPGGRR